LGIDNSKPLVSYCMDNISTINDKFIFQHVDVYNGAYAPEGKQKPHEFIFPIEDESVDIVIMCSVFTHMHSNDIQAYIEEVHRVLKKGGLFISSLNLYNRFTCNQIEINKSHLDIKYRIDEGIYSLDTEIPERGFAHDEEMIKEFYWQSGFRIKEIKYAIWSSKDLTGEFHDYIIAQK
jgi:SAM-dependent methyltransferase